MQVCVGDTGYQERPAGVDLAFAQGKLAFRVEV
jgi:hypothetical protein